MIQQTFNSSSYQYNLQLGDGLGSDRNALNGTFITSPANSEVAVLAPAGAPAVLDNPVLLSCLVTAAVSHQQHGMVGQLERAEGVSEAGMVVDALLVVEEVTVNLQIKQRLFIFYVMNYVVFDMITYTFYH